MSHGGAEPIRGDWRQPPCFLATAPRPPDVRPTSWQAVGRSWHQKSPRRSLFTTSRRRGCGGSFWASLVALLWAWALVLGRHRRSSRATLFGQRSAASSVQLSFSTLWHDRRHDSGNELMEIRATRITVRLSKSRKTFAMLEISTKLDSYVSFSGVSSRTLERFGRATVTLGDTCTYKPPLSRNVSGRR